MYKLRKVNLLFLVLFGCTLLKGGLFAAPVEISSGSGNYNLPSTNIEGVRFFGAAGSRNVSNWNVNFSGFQWNGTNYSSGPLHGIVNQTGNTQTFTVFTLQNDMIFDVGSGIVNFTNWGSNLNGKTLTVRGSGGNFNVTGSITSSQSNGGLIIDSGINHFSVGGPVSTSGGNVHIYGGGTGSMNGATLSGGSLTVHGDRNLSFANTTLSTGGGNLNFLGGGNHTFTGQVQTNGGDLIWSGAGGGTFSNTTSSGGGNMIFSNTGNFTFGGQLLTGGGDFLWTVEGDANFNNNLNAAGGQIRFEGVGELTFSNPVQTTTLNGDIYVGGSQIVNFTNTLSTSGGSITFGDGASVNTSNTINTNGGAFNVEGSALVTTSNTINTGGGDINITSSGGFSATGNVSTNGGTIYVTGDGVTDFSAGVSTANGNIVLSGNGTTMLANDPSLGSGEIIVIGGGTLILDSDGTGSNTSSTRINVLLEGGTFRTAGADRYIGTLTLSEDSRIDMGASGSSLMDINTYAAINNFNPWDNNSLITIENFDVGGDLIRFNNGSGIFGNEGFFRFEGDYGEGFGIYYATLDSLGGGAYRLIPGGLDHSMVVIPEPGTWFAGISLLVIGGVHFYRRRLQLKQKATETQGDH